MMRGGHLVKCARRAFQVSVGPNRPPWLPVLGYALVAWHIGLSFTADLGRGAWRACWTILLSLVALIEACTGPA